MDVSVIIPSYNRAHLLGRALNSVLAQSLPADEIIVVDDGSEDQTKPLLQQKYPQVRCISTAHRGVSAARNVGIKSAKGRWIALLDSDDEWLADKLKTQMCSVARHASVQVFHSEEIWMRQDKRVNPMKKHAKHSGQIFEHCLPLCCVSPSTVLIQRKLLLAHGGFDESLPACEDYDLWLRIFAHHPVHLDRAQLVIRYAGHGDQLSQKYWGMDRFRVQSLAKLLRSNQLDAQQQRLVRDVLLKKLDILIVGSQKRRNLDMLEYCQNLKCGLDSSGFE